MKNIAIAAVYLGFFALIGWSTWNIGNAWPLVGLILIGALPKFDVEPDDGFWKEDDEVEND